MTNDDESLNRALADVEMLKAAYPEEIVTNDNDTSLCSFPLGCCLYLSRPDNFVKLKWTHGYPITSGIQISSYRVSSCNKKRMDAVIREIREASQQCLNDGIEGSLICCAAALEAWNNEYEYCFNDDDDPNTNNTTSSIRDNVDCGIDDDDGAKFQLQSPQQRRQSNALPPTTTTTVEWIVGEPLMDRKSTFVARVCRVSSERQVHRALYQLLDGNTKLQRATHNMYAYRLSEELLSSSAGGGDGDGRVRTTVVVKKFDNNDDGEDGAGKCLARLLEMRNEDGVLVVVSRWYGGIKLGPKRFAHISNVARELLVQCHEKHWKVA